MSMKAKLYKRIYLIIFFVIVILATMILFFYSFIAQNHIRKALPSDATEISEYEWNHYFPPDYCYYLKAKISSDAFLAYRQKLKFVAIADEMPGTFAWYGIGGKTDNWWDPGDVTGEAYYNPNTTGSHIAIMKYENGYLYYKETIGF